MPINVVMPALKRSLARLLKVVAGAKAVCYR